MRQEGSDKLLRFRPQIEVDIDEENSDVRFDLSYVFEMNSKDKQILIREVTKGEETSNIIDA